MKICFISKEGDLMKSNIIDLSERKIIRESQKLFSISIESLECKSLLWHLVSGESFCKKKLTGEFFYIPKNYKRTDDEIEVQNRDGNLTFISVDTLMPYPQLYDTIKVVFNDKTEKKHKIIPPDWDMTFLMG